MHDGDINFLLRLSEHRNGYTREDAVKRLGALGNPIALPRLIARANDWVAPIRIAAKEAIVKLATTDNAAAFVTNLPALYHLHRCGRDDHRDLISLVEHYLASHPQPLVQGIKHTQRHVARACLSLVIRHKLLGPADIINLGLRQVDLMLRLTVSSLLKTLAGSVQNTAAELAIKDPFMPVRRAAFQCLLKHQMEDDMIKKHLFDRHSTIRLMAIEAMQLRNFNVALTYENMLTTSSILKLRCALWGVGELKHTACIPRIEQCLTNSPYASVRKQSLTSLAGLLGASFEHRIDGFLSDSSPAVCREAARLCVQSGIGLTADRLTDITRQSRHSHVSSVCFYLAKKTNKWESLIFLLALSNSKNRQPWIRDTQLAEGIRHWNHNFNKNSTRPTAGQIKALQKNMQNIACALNTPRFRTILFTLKIYGIAL